MQSKTRMLRLGTPLAFPGGVVGEGHFTVPEDRAKLATVLSKMLTRKLRLLLKAQDLVGYRLLLSMQSLGGMRRRFRIYSLVAQSQPSTHVQKPKKNTGPRSVYLRGLRGVEPAPGLVPIDSDVDSSPCASCSCTWLLQYGFSSVHDADSAGWTPLHYAVLGGNVTIVQDLLQLKADVNRRTWLPQPQIGALPFMSSLDICMLFGQNDAAPVASLGTIFHVYYDIGIPLRNLQTYNWDDNPTYH